MNYRELHGQLNEKIHVLNDQHWATEKALELLTKDQNQLEALREENRQVLVKGLIEAMGGQSTAGIRSFFESLDPEQRASLSKVETVVDRAFDRIEEMKAELPHMEAIDSLEEQIDVWKKEHQSAIERYDAARKKVRLFESDDMLMDCAESFADYWGHGRNEDYEILISGGSFMQSFKDFFWDKNKRAKDALRMFNSRTNNEDHAGGMYSPKSNRLKLDALGLPVGDPLAFLDGYKKAQKKEKSEFNKAHDRKIKIQLAIDKLEKRRAAEGALIDNVCAERVFFSIEKLLTKNENAYLAVGDYLKPDVRVDIDKGQKQPWDHARFWELQAKISGVQAMRDHKESIMKSLKGTVDSLDRAKSKISSKMSRIGSKPVKNFDWINPEESINKLIGQSAVSNEWVLKNRESLNNGQYGGFGDNILLWTAVYLTFSGDNNTQDFGPQVMDATESFKQTLQTDIAQAGDMGLAEGLESMTGDMSILDTLPSAVSGMGGLDSIGSSLDSTISSMTSSIDSSVSSSFSSGGFDSGGFGGGF